MTIKDEFADLPISRQRKYQLRMSRSKRCQYCGKPADFGSRCLKHFLEYRQRDGKKRGSKRPYNNAYMLKFKIGERTMNDPLLPPQDNDIRALPKREFGARWGISQRTVRRLMDYGLPHVRLTRNNVRIPVKEADVWIIKRYGNDQVTCYRRLRKPGKRKAA